MKARHFAVILLAFVFASSTVWADQIFLKNGQRYSGKFIRGDAGVVEFRILGRIETFPTNEVSQILFEEPEIKAPKPAEAPAVKAPTAPVQEAPPTTEPPSPATETTAAAVPVPAPTPKVASDSVTFPAGTTLVIRTTTVIDTDRNRVGDPFHAILEDPLTADGQTIVPQGADVTGTIAYANESGKLSGHSELILELTELQAGGKTFVLRTSDYSQVGEDRGKQTAKAVGGGAAVGAIIGAIAGGGKGAAVGAATGAAVGTGVQVLTKGQTLKVPAETLLEFRLEHDLTLPRGPSVIP